jgi:hypothetical protein
VHGGHSEVAGSELVGKPVNLSSGVAEDDSLGDGDGLVQVGKCVQLPVLLLDSNVELLDTLEGQFGFLDQNADWVTHELGGDLENVLRHGGGKKDDLGRLREELEDVVDLLGETALRVMLALVWKCMEQTYRKHLIGLIEDEHLHAVGLENATLDHVVNTTWSTDDNLRAILKSLHVLTDIGTTDAGMALNVHEVTNGDNDLLNLLRKFSGGGEDQSLASLELGIDLLEARN